MNTAICKTAIFLLAVVAFPCIGAENTESREHIPFFTWDFYWSGSWYNSIKTDDGESLQGEDLFSGGTLFNRGNFSLGMPSLDMSFRFLATDKRLLPPEEDDGKAGFNPGAGIYHYGSGSRFLYGVQSEYGLPARMKNVWIRSAPFMESRSPSSRDLKTEPSAQDSAETYLLLALPQIHGFNAFTSAALDEELNPAIAAGFAFNIDKTDLRLESFYTGKKLPPRKISTWFSSSPPLPERDFNFYAFGLFFNSPFFGFASDWALSETFAWGKGNYGNFALRMGNKPWRFSLAGDGSGVRFADRGGATAGAGFRIAAKAERFWPRSGLLRLQGTIRSPGLEESFNRGSFSAYYRPSALSAAERRNNPNPIRFSRASIAFGRDARNPEKSIDSLDAMAAFTIGPFSTALSCALDCLSCLDESGSTPPLFCFPLFETFDSFKISLELGLKPGIFDIRAKLGYTERAEKDSIWDPSLSCTVRPGKWGRFGFKIAFTDFPDKWNYTISWRLDKL